MKDIRITKLYHPCQELPDEVGVVKAYINSTESEIYIEVSYYDREIPAYTVLNADTAEKLARDILKMVKEIRQNG